MKIQVNLVGAEGGPDGFYYAGGRLEAGQQRQRPRPYHLQQIRAAADLDKILAVARVAGKISLEPLALGRNVLVCFLPLRGGGFEDSITINQKLQQISIVQ